MLNKGNAEEHLSKAIEIDQKILFKVSSDKICKKHPDLVKKLQTKYSQSNGEF